MFVVNISMFSSCQASFLYISDDAVMNMNAAARFIIIAVGTSEKSLS